jgi:hypothetical protein
MSDGKKIFIISIAFIGVILGGLIASALAGVVCAILGTPELAFCIGFIFGIVIRLIGIVTVAAMVVNFYR